MKRLSKKQFDRALRKGHGRALMHIKRYGIGEYLPLLEKACLESYVYDPQIEGGRCWWLTKLVYATGNKLHFWKLFEKNFSNYSSLSDLYQYGNMATNFITDGATSLKKSMYENFEPSFIKFQDAVPIGSNLISFDGFEALGFTARIVAKHTSFKRDDDAWFYKNACEELGKRRVDAFLEKIPECKIWHEYVKNEYISYFKLKAKAERPEPDLVSISNWIEQIDTRRPNIAKYARNASKAELKLLFAKLKKYKDETSVWRCLKIFNYADLPVVDDFILDLVSSKNESFKIRNSAFDALARKKSNKIRTFAINLINSDRSSICYGAIGLFNKNYRKPDSEFLFAKLFVPENESHLHNIGFDLIALFDQVKDLNLTDCAIWVYENTPCTFCRSSIVRKLIEWKNIPTEIIEEGLYDSFDETRDICKKFRRRKL
ncbi:MAG: hypothetical protein SFY67_01300 [Candidatus Melainabacteria bacterium]|nr:hypothetical protein [Candidatus Melainabacteria bacterium]